MQFRVLGPVEVAVGERRLAVASAKQRVILAVLLAARGEAVSVGALVDAMWGTSPPPSARRSLHSHVSRLRRQLASDAPDAAGIVLTEADGYRLLLPSHDLDADRFEELVAEARRHLDTEPEQAAEQLDEALGLWRGAAFGELADHDIVRAEAVRLDQLRAAAAADRVDVLLEIRDPEVVVPGLQAAVATDALAERPHGQLMLALYRSGKQADALGLYRRLQQRLADELGIDPSPQLQTLHERILRQDAGLAGPIRTRSAGDRPTVSSVVGGREAMVPLAADPHEELIGRDEDVRVLVGLVATTSLVTLTGPGGVGKSRLAEAVAAAAGGGFADGVVVCPLAAVRDAAGVDAALVSALGIHLKGDAAPQETVLAALGTRRLLLVLDNCEHVLAPVGQVTHRIRSRCPNVAVLATSREHLRLSGEQVWEVAPLRVPGPDASAAEVMDTPAGALLCARARSVEPSFALTEVNAVTVAELCRRLDGIPLAIELAAARIRALAPGELAERIDHRFQLLTGGPHRDAGRHRTLKAVVDWSYELLTDPEACLFERLSVFAGSFQLDAVEQVCADDPLTEPEIAGLLADLVDKSLVAVDRGEGRVRYRLLDTLRAYGAARLEDTGAAEDAHRAHAGYHLDLAEQLGHEVRGPDEVAALTRLDASLDDLRVAHDWLIGAGEVGAALRLPAALHDDLTFQPRVDVFAWADRALRVQGAKEDPACPAALATAARGAVNRGELERARELAEQARDGADPGSITALWALYVLTNVALYEGRLDDVLELADRRIRLADALGEPFHQALAGASRALAHRYRGDVPAAVASAAEAREAAEVSGNHTARAWTLYSNGEALLETDHAEAVGLLERAIEAARRVDRAFIEGVALVSLASLCGRNGETGRALDLFRTTVAHWRRLGDYTHQLTTLRNLVELLARIGVDEPAALLHGAVTAGATPTFGPEAERMATAWASVEGRLGADVALDAAERGRQLTPAGMVDAALAQLDELRAAPGPHRDGDTR